MIANDQEKVSGSDVENASMNSHREVNALKDENAKAVAIEAFHRSFSSPEASASMAAAYNAEATEDASSLSFSVLNDYSGGSCLNINVSDELMSENTSATAQKDDAKSNADFWATEQRELEKLKRELDVYNAEKNGLAEEEVPKKHVDDDEPKIIANINERNERAEIKFKRNISNAFQKRAILWIRAELRKSTNYLEAANRIKRKFDEKFGTEWTCLLGASAKERLGVFSHHRETTSILNVLFPRSGLRIVLFKQQSGSFSSKEAKSACEVKEVGFLCLFCGVLLGFIIAFVLSCGIVDTRVRNNKKSYETNIKQLNSTLKTEVAARLEVESRLAKLDTELGKEIAAIHEAERIVKMVTMGRKNTSENKFKEIEAKLEKLGEGNYKDDEVLISEGQLPKSVQQGAIELAVEGLKKYNNSDEHMKSAVVNHIQTEFNKKYGPLWDCVGFGVRNNGRDFGWALSQNNSRYFLFWHGQVRITLFKPIVEEPTAFAQIAEKFFEFVDKLL